MRAAPSLMFAVAVCVCAGTPVRAGCAPQTAGDPAICAGAFRIASGWRVPVGGHAQPGFPAAGAAAPAAPCESGFVWRVARSDDLICVTPQSRALAAQENALAASLRDPNGAYGAMSCISGFVWRLAFEGDQVCVSPARRAAVAQENYLGPNRIQPPAVGYGSSGGGSGGGDPN